VKEKTAVKPLLGNIKLKMGNSMKDKYEYSKRLSTSIKGPEESQNFENS